MARKKNEKTENAKRRYFFIVVCWMERGIKMVKITLFEARL